MQLRELIVAVKEKNLTKTDLETYRDSLSSLFAEMMIELADLEKDAALFIEQSEEPTAIAKKNKWKASTKGQREIVLKRYCLATKELLNSLKSRLYSVY